MFTRERVRGWLGVLGAVAVFAAVMPSLHYKMGGDLAPAARQYVRDNPNAMPFTETYRFGWPGSPLVHYHGEQTLAVADDGGVKARKTKGGSIGWRSWSSLTLAVGVGLLGAARRLKSPPKPPEPVS